MQSVDVHNTLRSSIRFLMSSNNIGPWTQEWRNQNARNAARRSAGLSTFQRIGQFFGWTTDDVQRTPGSAADPLRIVRPTGFETLGPWKWTESEDIVVRSPKMPSFGGSLSSQDVEYILCCMTVPYVRLPLILRFIARRGASAIASSMIVRSFLE